MEIRVKHSFNVGGINSLAKHLHYCCTFPPPVLQSAPISAIDMHISLSCPCQRSDKPKCEELLFHSVQGNTAIVLVVGGLDSIWAMHGKAHAIIPSEATAIVLEAAHSMYVRIAEHNTRNGRACVRGAKHGILSSKLCPWALGRGRDEAEKP